MTRPPLLTNGTAGPGGPVYVGAGGTGSGFGAGPGCAPAVGPSAATSTAASTNRFTVSPPGVRTPPVCARRGAHGTGARGFAPLRSARARAHLAQPLRSAHEFFNGLVVVED